MYRTLPTAAIFLPLCTHAQLITGCLHMGGNEFELAPALVQTNDGGYAFTGLTLSYSAGTMDQNSYVVKIDANGAMEWNTGYGTAPAGEVDAAYDLIQTTDGGYLLASGGGSASLGVTKLDAGGVVQWSRKYDTELNAVDDPYAVVQTPDGGYLLAGSGGHPFQSSILPVLIKLDAAGDIEWSKAYFTSFGTQEAYDVVVALDGGYALCGYHTSTTTGFHVIRVDDSGDVIWGKSYGTGFDIANAIVNAPDSGFVLAGRTNTYGFAVPGDNDDALLMKLDKDGGLDWARAFGDATRSEEFLGVVHTTDGGYAMAGQAVVPPIGIGAPGIYVAKCDANGNRSWSQRMGSPGQNGIAYDVIECSNDGLAITGILNVSGNVQITFMKMGADGTICPACGADPHGLDSAAVIAPVDQIYVVYDSVATSGVNTIDVFAGGTAGTGCLETGIAEAALTEMPLVPLPNPAPDRCTVLGFDGDVHGLELRSLQGTLVQYTAVNSSAQAIIPLEHIAQGTYIVRTVGAARSRHGRIVVAR